jgi:hypothetical protein
VQNPDFDVDDAHWTADPNVQISRAARDAAGNAQSGALDVSFSGADPNAVTKAGASQCVGVMANASYDVAAQILIPGQTASLGGIDLWYYASGDCSGAPASSTSLPLSAATSWHDVMATVTMPAGVQSAALRLVVLKPYVQTSAEALFDDVLFTRH